MSLWPSMFLLLLIICFSLMGFFTLLFQTEKELNYCISKVTAIAREQRKSSLAILKLNPYAKALRVQRKIAENSYRLAPPHLKAAALAYLKTIKLSQKFLRARQKTLFLKSKILFNKEILLMQAKSYILTKGSQDLHLKAQPKNSDSPSYFPEKNYESKKRFVLKKQIFWLRPLPRSIRALLFGSTVPSIKTQSCGAATLLKSGKPWKNQIILDKF